MTLSARRCDTVKADARGARLTLSSMPLRQTKNQQHCQTNTKHVLIGALVPGGLLAGGCLLIAGYAVGLGVAFASVFYIVAREISSGLN